MKKAAVHERIKGKVFTGFVILLALVLAAIFITIRLTSQLTPPDAGVSQSVTKLSLVSNMLSSLIDADGQARAYISTGQKKYLYNYRRHEKEIRQLTDSLKNLSIENSDQYERMMVVDSLLDLKKRALDSYLRHRSSSEQNIISPERLQNIVDRFSDTIGVTTKTPGAQPMADEEAAQNTETARRSNFLKRLWSNLTGKTSKSDSLVKPDRQQNLPDTILTYTTLNDTAIESIRRQLERMGEEERIERQLAMERELMLLRTDQIILDEIRNVLILFEQEELNRAIQGAENSNEVLRKLWNTALASAIIGIITILIFVILIWKDLARSAFYRKKLEEARLLAEKLLKVKEMFLANMSHEIRTPITSIIGFSEQMKNTRLSKEQSRYLNYINSSSEHLLRLIDDLLDFSRIESGNLQLESRPFNVKSLFDEAFHTLQAKASQKGLEMKFDFRANAGINVLGDDLRIRQIIFNLLNNSIKFTHKGSITLLCDAKYIDDEVLLFFSVSDTGIGIPPEKQQDMFREFTQSDPGITRKYGGSGLGLAICRRLTDMMGGKISLSSVQGEGTTIEVSLMLKKYEGEIMSGKQIFKGSLPDLTGLKILLAEDDEATRILITENLLACGATVLENSSGTSAWAAFEDADGDLDLLISDIQMPGMSGPELVKKIADWYIFNNAEPCPVLGLTAHATPEDIHNLIKAGFSDILLKPFRQSGLFEKINHLLDIEFSDDMEKPLQDAELFITDLNLEIFKEFANHDEQALRKILASLADAFKLAAESLTKALQQNDYQLIANIAHRILPNTRNLAAEKTALKLMNLESLRSKTAPDNTLIKKEIDETVAELNYIEKELRKLI
jgi:signal transduction histidine kinase/DNA-binding response OmpR family regulator